MRQYLRSFVPERGTVSARERIRTALGGLLGILATGLLSRIWLGDGATLPVLIAPMGASAVLLFAVPTSPLAQPWSIIGGNLVAATVGVTAAATVTDPIAAAALAEGCAIALMMLLRCVHPPSGAVALTAVLGGPAITRLGYGFVIWPVAANSLLLLAGALLFNNLTGRRYPHVPIAALPNGKADPVRSAGRITASDLDAVLKDFDQVLEIGRGDLEAILRQVQNRANLRRSGGTTCEEVMSRDVIAIAPHASLREALALLRRHRVKMLPVTDDHARVIGVITQSDLLDKTVWGSQAPRLGLLRRLSLTMERGRAPHGCVEDIMSRHIVGVRPSTPVAEVVHRMADAGVHHLPVVEANDRLAGLVTQADLVAALLADTAARASEVSRGDPSGLRVAPNH